MKTTCGEISAEEINRILLRRKNRMFGDMKFEPDIKEDISILKNAICEIYLKSGFVPSIGLINHYINMTKACNILYNDLNGTALDTFLIPLLEKDISLIRETFGMNRRYVQLYKNMDTAEEVRGSLYAFTVQCIHYLSSGTWYPDDKEDIRDQFVVDYDSLILIDAADGHDILELFKSIISSKVSIREQDYSDINILMTYLILYENTSASQMLNIVKENCVYKEILVKVVTYLLKPFCRIDSSDLITLGLFGNYKDILRLTVSLLDGNPALCEHPLIKTKTMSEDLRKLIMELMNFVPLRTLDQTKPDREAWIVIGDVIKPYSFIPKNVKIRDKSDISRNIHILNNEIPRYANALTAWCCIRENISYMGQKESFEELMKFGKIKEAVDVIKVKPALFCRRIDYILRKSSLTDGLYVISEFDKVLETADIPIPTLLTLRRHFSNRKNKTDIRIFSIKSTHVKLFSREEYREPIGDTLCTMIISSINDAINRALSKKEPMKNVYLNADVFRGLAVPRSLRNQSSGRLIPRGSRFSIPKEVKYLVPYIWWTNPKNGQRLDLDLSAYFYTKDFKTVNKMFYGNTTLTSHGVDACHSGDITNGGDYNGHGVAEHILINLDILGDIKYIVFTVHSFLSIPFTEQEHSFAGYLLYTESYKEFRGAMKEFIDHGKVDRSHLEHEVNLSSPSTDSIIAVYDVDNREIVWADQPGEMTTLPFTNVNDTKNSTLIRVMNLLQERENLLYDLIYDNVINRGGHFVDNKEEADIIFDEFSGDEVLDAKTIAPWNVEYFASELL